jgi:hypothetical protein
MWQPLLNSNQLNEGSRLRQTLHDGDFQHESIYVVKTVKNFYFMVQYIEQDRVEIQNESQFITPYRVLGIPYYGFEIWTE